MSVGKRTKGECDRYHRAQAGTNSSWTCKCPDKPFLNSEKLLEPFEMEMSINLESRQLVMQIASHLIKKKRKRSTHWKNLCEINRLSARTSSLFHLVRQTFSSITPPLDLPFRTGFWEPELENTLKSIQFRLGLTEEWKPEGIKVVSTNTNLVAELVQDTGFPNYLSYLPCSFSPQRFHDDKKYDASTSLYLHSKLLKGR